MFYPASSHTHFFKHSVANTFGCLPLPMDNVPVFFSFLWKQQTQFILKGYCIKDGLAFLVAYSVQGLNLKIATLYIANRRIFSVYAVKEIRKASISKESSLLMLICTRGLGQWSLYGRGFQPGVRVPLGVRGIFSGGSRTSLPNLHHFVGKGRSGLHVVSRTNRWRSLHC